MYIAGFELRMFDLLPVQQRVHVLHGLLEALIFANQVWLRANPGTPELYRVGPKYKIKARPFDIDRWQDIPQTMALNEGDCKDFSAWRIAEMRNRLIPDVAPFIKVNIIPDPSGRTQGLICYHVQVRQGLSIEDPSVLLGMPKSLSPQNQLRLVQGMAI